MQSHSISRGHQGQGREVIRRFRPELLPPPRTFYAKEFGQLRRASRGWARVRCCFHNPDRDPSLAVNVENGAFNCFSCGTKGGDIVAFVMARDGLSFKDAAKFLHAWDGSLRIDVVVIRKAEAERARREQQHQHEEEVERDYFAAESWLYGIEEIYRQSNCRLSELRRGAAPASPDEEEILWDVLALAQNEIREAESNFVRLRCAWPGAPHNYAAQVRRDGDSRA